MRCGCPQCGTYMVQREEGLESACACPACLFACNACMGTKQAPASRAELAAYGMALARLRLAEEEWEQ